MTSANRLMWMFLRAVARGFPVAKNPKRIVVFRNAGLGDFLLTVPALTALRRLYPDSRITLLTSHSSNGDVAARIASYAGGAGSMPWLSLAQPHLIDDAIIIGRPSLSRETLGALLGARRRGFDLAVNIVDVGTPAATRFKRWAFLALATGRVRQLGLMRPIFADPDPARHAAQAIGHHIFGPLSFLGELGLDEPYDPTWTRMDVRVSETARARAAALKARWGARGDLIALAPGFILPHKAWPWEKFSALCGELLRQRPEATIVLIGVANQADIAEAIRAADPQRIISLFGQTSVEESAALFALCDLVVANDGGAAHLADAVGAPVVSIVPGIEAPNSVEPWNSRHLAVRRPTPCAPCYGFMTCATGTRECVLDIPVEDVLQKCRSVLGGEDPSASSQGRVSREEVESGPES